MGLEQIQDWFTGRDRNKEFRAAETAERKRRKKETNRINTYQDELDEADKENYLAMRDWRYETAVDNWERGKEIQDYQYAQALAAYEKSEDIYEGQLTYNKQAASLAINDQQASIQDLALQQAFQREAMHSDLMNEIKRGGIQKLEKGAKLYGIKSSRRISDESIQQQLNQITTQNTFKKEAEFVEGLKKSGKAALGQAGVSRKKTLQSTAAESFRELVALDSSLSGSRNKAAVDLLKVYVDASLGETQVGLNLDMIELGINAAKDEVKYNNRILEANMQSAINQLGRNIEQIQLQKRGADLQAEADLNIFPEKFNYAPEPQIEPERKFVDRLDVITEPVAKGQRVATGFNSVLEVVADVGDIVASVTGFGNLVQDIPGMNDWLDFGNKASGGSAYDIFKDIQDRGGLNSNPFV